MKTIFVKLRRSYKISIENETRLENIASRSFSPPALFALGLGIAIFLMAFGALIVGLSPLHRFFPGYLKDSQRAATEEALMRIDSLQNVSMLNEAYISNIKNVLDISRTSSDSLIAARRLIPFSADSLLPRSNEEARFAAMMQDREKFNVSAIASLASEGMLMFPVSDDGVVRKDTTNNYVARIVLPSKASIMAIADGVVIAGYRDSKSRTYTLLTQHDNGFVSSIAGLDELFVGESDLVRGGESIARVAASAKRKSPEVAVALWHNGNPVKPFNYIAGHRFHPAQESKSIRREESKSSSIKAELDSLGNQ